MRVHARILTTDFDSRSFHFHENLWGFFSCFGDTDARWNTILGTMRGPRPFWVLFPLGDDTSNGPVLLARWWLVTGWWPGWPGRSWRSMMQRGCWSSWWRRRMHPVSYIFSLFAAGRRRRRSILLFLQQLSELLDRLVQGPQLRQ